MRSWSRSLHAGLERFSLLPGRDGGPERIRYSLPRHKRGQWVGPGRKRKAADPEQHDDLPVIDIHSL